MFVYHRTRTTQSNNGHTSYFDKCRASLPLTAEARQPTTSVRSISLPRILCSPPPTKIIKVTIFFSLKNQSNYVDWNDTTLLLHHPYILCHFAKYALCLSFVYIGGLWKAVRWVVLHGSVVNLTCIEKSCSGWLQLNHY